MRAIAGVLLEVMCSGRGDGGQHLAGRMHLLQLPSDHFDSAQVSQKAGAKQPSPPLEQLTVLSPQSLFHSV